MHGKMRKNKMTPANPRCSCIKFGYQSSLLCSTTSYYN